MLLDAQPGLRVVGEAGDAQEAMELAGRLRPDLILLDLTLPQLDGIAALPLLRKVAPSSKVLVLTMHDDEGYLRQAFRAGASGYVLKKAADAHLVTTDLDWVIVRPGTLTNEPGTGRIAAGPALEYGTVPRDDVAAFLAAVLHEPAVSRTIVELTAGGTPVAEAVAALAR